MFKPLSFYIGLRYTRAKRRNHFISFISLISMLGIALGVMVLITVLSVMNGFDYQIQHKIFSLAKQVTIMNIQNRIDNWQQVQDQIKTVPDVLGSAPFVSGQAMISQAGMVFPVMVNGILPQEQDKISELKQHIVSGNLGNLREKKFGIVLGQILAEKIGAAVGSKIVLITPQATISPLGLMPRYRQFTVVAIFHVSGGFGFDQSLVYLNLHDAQALYQTGSGVSGIQVKVNNLFNSVKVTNELQNRLGVNFIVSNWTQEFGAFFKAVKMEKTMMFFILLLIIAVAAFNLVSTLVMVVTDKRSDIAILRTLGASPGMIMRIFVVQGFLIGIFGTLLGVIFGVLMALNVTSIVNFIQHLFHVQFISSSVYFIDYLPSRLEWSDVLHIGIYALVMSLLATLYPAWTASRTQPAEALRYE